jgi:hypothetical protein
VVSAADLLRSLISVFETEAAIFPSSSSSFKLSRAGWTPFQTHCYSENLVASAIEPGAFGLAARPLDHRGDQMLATVTVIELINIPNPSGHTRPWALLVVELK